MPAYGPGLSGGMPPGMFSPMPVGSPGGPMRQPWMPQPGAPAGPQASPMQPHQIPGRGWQPPQMSFGGGPQGIAEMIPLLMEMQGGGPQSMNGGGLQGGPQMQTSVSMNPGQQSPMQGSAGMTPGQPPRSMHGSPVPQPGMGAPQPRQRGQLPVYTQPSTQNLPWVQNGQMKPPAYAGGLAGRLQAQRQGRVSRPGAAPSGGASPPRGISTPRPRGPQDSDTGRKVPQMNAPPFYPGGGGNAASLKKR